jgi:hypothetical protein
MARMSRTIPKFQPTLKRKELRPKLCPGSEICSASFDRRSKNVLVVPIIVAELELGNIKVQILFAHLVEGAVHAPFDERPEASARQALARIVESVYS